jgi:hypothetical protein
MLHSAHYLYCTAGRMASNLNLETGLNCTSPRGSQRRREVQPRQLAHRCVQRTPLGRFLASPLDGASSGPHRPGRFFHCMALLLGTTGFTVGGISTDVTNNSNDTLKSEVFPWKPSGSIHQRHNFCEVLLIRSNHFTQCVSFIFFFKKSTENGHLNLDNYNTRPATDASPTEELPSIIHISRNSFCKSTHRIALYTAQLGSRDDASRFHSEDARFESCPRHRLS